MIYLGFQLNYYDEPYSNLELAVIDRAMHISKFSWLTCVMVGSAAILTFLGPGRGGAVAEGIGKPYEAGEPIH